ncbi:MAG TPA: DUF535 family protein [Opitutaceae bacterium]|nr:DUF535 family protein [Opitutaceae bacterium]
MPQPTPFIAAGADSLAAATSQASQPRRIPFSFWTASAQIHPTGALHGLRQRLKFFVRAWKQPRLTHAWLARLVQADLAPLWMARPRLATKLQRPYVHCEWRVLERFGALMGHYDMLPGIFSAEIRQAIYRDGLGLICLTNPVSGRQLDVRLFYHDQFEKEGELTLAIREAATGLALAGLTFCLAQPAHQRTIIIGGLQASPDPQTHRLIHDVTKEMHCLRPKALALWCLQQLATCWLVGRIEAVGDGQHIYRHWRKRREFATSYDEFWSESDGRRLPGGGWELPLQLKQRTRAELKPSRRKTHERRYAMLAALQPKLIAATAALAPGNARLKDPMEFVYSSSQAESVKIPGPTCSTGKHLPGLAVTNHSF